MEQPSSGRIGIELEVVAELPERDPRVVALDPAEYAGALLLILPEENPHRFYEDGNEQLPLGYVEEL